VKDVNPPIDSGRKGDVIAIAPHHVGERERLGEVVAVLGTGEHIRYRVRWDDGSETIFYPGGDARIQPRA